MKCAIYARVSTKAKSTCSSCGKLVRVAENRLIVHADRNHQPCAGTGALLEETADQGQDTENQLIQLREYCRRQDWEIVAEYVDRESGKHAQREAFLRMFVDASRRSFDVVLVWALDRFTREGVYETFDHVKKLSDYRVQFESFSEPQFRTTGQAGELMIAIAAWIAKQERIRISERTKAGVARARTQGKHCGRPTRVFRRDRAADLRRQGMSWRAIGRELGVPQSTIRAALGVQKV